MPGRQQSEIKNFIRKAARRNRPIFKSFKKLCRLHPNLEFDYVDFELKYYGFYHEHPELTMVSSPLKFSDLPMDTLEKVVGKLDLLDCLILRKVSRDLRSLVDSSEISCENVEIWIDNVVCTILKINDWKLTYEKAYDGCEVTFQRKNIRRTKIIEGAGNYKLKMASDASAILRLPKLKIDKISFAYMDQIAYINRIFPQELLDSLPSQLNARTAVISVPGEAVSWLLKSLNPEKLEDIKLAFIPCTVDQVNEISKMGKMIRMCWCFLPKEVGIEQLFQFKKIQSGDFDLTEENLIKIRDNLLKSPHLEYCQFNQYNNIPDDMDTNLMHEKIDRIMDENPAYDVETRRFSIPNCRDYFQLEFERASFYIVLKISKIFC